MIIDQKNRPIQGSLGIEELSFDYFNKLVFYRCGQILSNTKKNSEIVQALIDNIVSVMVSYYSEQVKHMMDSNDPGAISNISVSQNNIQSCNLLTLNQSLDIYLPKQDINNHINLVNDLSQLREIRNKSKMIMNVSQTRINNLLVVKTA